ncbi:Colicin V production protein [Gimesia panareensis]|uniref:Colicin V production protein n=1 Tax=Gimesia panareensis TaxID=2527978 RepID=A0A518FL02_9PLAN|nr:CvpA family protein [Gimesia panareensis]QDV16969.1 Colicin V production protein [Gimesia panareensis]
MWFDLLIVAILIYAVWKGASKGVVWQLAAIAALVLCFAFAESLSLHLAPMINVKPPLNRWIAMLAIYIGFSFISFTLARSLKSAIDSLKFNEFDRHLGAVLGLLKGVVFSLFLIFFLITISETARAAVLKSHSGYAAAVMLNEMAPVMPAELHELLDECLVKLNYPGVPMHHDDDDVFHNDHQHADDNPFPPGSNDLPSPFFEKPGGSGSDVRTTNQDSLLKDILKRIPSYLRGELEDKIIEAYNSTAPEDREQFANQLKSQIPGVLRRVTSEWQDGQPQAVVPTNNSTFGANGTQQLASERTQLLKKIAAVYSDYPEAQNSLIEEFELNLSGLPDQVVMAVLRDWKTDLLLDGGDPDPQTDVTTPLDARVLRQLQLQRVPLNSLGAALQQRMQSVQRR